VLSVLERHVPPEVARQLLRETLRYAIDSELPSLLKVLAMRVRFHVPTQRRTSLLADLNRLTGAPSIVRPHSIAVQSDFDAGRARSLARVLCQELGARPLPTQQVVTGVSELARNALQYAGGGEIELLPQHEPPTMRVNVRDYGSGIADLDDVLEGRKLSSTGLGRGLRGIKLMADTFHVETGPTGTTVTFEVILC
jgi:anti-sigma regulatory factor (Ser/Thr protein kinase)